MPKTVEDRIEEFWALNVKVGQLRRATTEFCPPEVPKRPRAATPKDIAALEKRLAVTVPPSFKALLLASNGARVAHGARTVPVDRHRDLLDRIRDGWRRVGPRSHHQRPRASP
jgi:cell wall assembly regulator SMI1